MKKSTLLSLVLFFCTGVLFAQNITLQINNNTTTNYTGTSIRNALESNNVALSSITHLTITAGDVTTADWNYLKAQKTNLTAMTHFTVTNGVTTVADIPNATDYKSYFKEDKIEEVSVAKLQNIGNYAFVACTSLTTESFPQATSIGNFAFYSCLSLTTLTLSATPPTVGMSAFGNTPTTRSVIVPNAAAITAYTNVNDGNTSDNLWYGWQLAELTPPVFENSTPTATNITTTGFTLATDIDEAGTIYYVIVADNATAPTPAEVKTGTGNAGTTPVTSGNQAVTTGAFTHNFTVTGLTQDTNYDVYVVAEDTNANLQYVTTKLDVMPTIQMSITITDASNTTSTVTGYSIENTLTNNSIGLATIVRLEITAGIVTTADWNYLKAQKANLTAMTHFTVTNGVTTVADIPNTTYNNQYFNKSKIEEVSIAGVQNIGNWVFSNCTSLTTAIFPQVMNIGNNAFNSCLNLTTTNFLQATTIGNNTFFDCRSLTTISLPLATSINFAAFASCSNLNSLILDGTPPTSVDTNAFHNTSTTRSLSIVGSVGPPLTGTALITAQNTYKGVNDGNTTDNLWYGWKIDTTPPTFENSTPIETNITTTGFTLATDIDEAGTIYYVILADNATAPTPAEVKAGTGNAGTTPVTSGSQAVTTGAFTHDFTVTGLTQDTNYDVYVVAEDANANLQYVTTKLDVMPTIPMSITITDASNATNTVTGSSIENTLTNNSIGLATIVRLEITAGKVTTADWNYLRAEKNNFTAMTHFTVTNGITIVADIPGTMFDPYFNASKIEEVSVAKLQSIGWGAFENCTSLTTVNFPQATSIGWGTFGGCTSLTTANFPQATSIGGGAFYGCTSLTTASFPQATSIGDNTFENCTSLTTASFPQATSIGDSMFENCTSLTTASFPQATSIGDYAFKNCTSLTTLTLSTTPPNVGTDAFNNTPTTRNLIITNNTGTPLTGTALTNAISIYDADEGANNDNLWHGWQLNGVIWTGATNQEWNTASNWYTNTVPTATDNVSIASNIATPTNTPIIGGSTPTAVTVNNLTVQTGAQLQVTPNSNITIDGDLVIQDNAIFGAGSIVTSSRTLASSTVKVNGTSTIGTTNSGFVYGAQTYEDNTVGWTLISSPVAGQSIPEFTTTQDLPTNNNNYAIAVYNNDGTNWNYYTGANGAGTGTYPLASAGNFEEGKGYTVRPNSSATTLPAPLTAGNNAVYFKGNLHTSDVSIAIDDKSSASGTAFNLVGNPYPSYISFSNLFTENHGAGKPLAEQTIWLWDKTTSSYVTVNQLTTTGTDMSANERPSLYIAPTQGFFVKSNSAGGNFTFTEAMQEHQTAGVFNRSSANEITQLTLKITDGQNNEKATNIYYLAGKTIYFDNGYDSSMFGGTTTNFGVYTALVGNSQGEKLAIQALPNENYDTMVVPVGIIAEAGKEITFSNVAKNVPSDVVVYLEDRTTGTFTNLTTDTYKVTLDKAQNSTGRFFVHTKSRALSTDAVSLAGVSIYKSNATTLTITGVQTANASVQVFNLLGKQMLAEKLTTSNVDNIALPSLATGVYIVRVQNGKGNTTKKIFIE